jgi:hypothetical protein
VGPAGSSPPAAPCLRNPHGSVTESPFERPTVAHMECAAWSVGACIDGRWALANKSRRRAPLCEQCEARVVELPLLEVLLELLQPQRRQHLPRGSEAQILLFCGVVPKLVPQLSGDDARARSSVAVHALRLVFGRAVRSGCIGIRDQGYIPDRLQCATPKLLRSAA